MAHHGRCFLIFWRLLPNKAAAEMKERVEKNLGNSEVKKFIYYQLFTARFGSAFYAVLKH
jgi:superfamily I DNA/RNA helicase